MTIPYLIWSFILLIWNILKLMLYTISSMDYCFRMIVRIFCINNYKIFLNKIKIRNLIILNHYNYFNWSMLIAMFKKRNHLEWRCSKNSFFAIDDFCLVYVDTITYFLFPIRCATKLSNVIILNQKSKVTTHQLYWNSSSSMQ